MSKILVTGGLGYIGSHTVVELVNKGYKVVIVDDLSNSSLSVLDGINKICNKSIKFEKLDLRNIKSTKDFIENNKDIGGVIHFAASKAVGESVENPLKYYTNNLFSLTNLLNELKNLNKEINFIFSSSATVYGDPKALPITESEPIKKAESPYGNTKQIGEEIIKDLVNSSSNFNAISLRYFNPIGAHPSALIGELPIGIP
ncbi:MAG: SDR family NAD(P)-dependent oxidoreductase, partial [Flavobacteriaceae bacterium]|nr:SDR family NAD(P)-dependent oxidoreductase [Flavobacteriaceae bacterium]